MTAVTPSLLEVLDELEGSDWERAYVLGVALLIRAKAERARAAALMRAAKPGVAGLRARGRAAMALAACHEALDMAERVAVTLRGRTL